MYDRPLERQKLAQIQAQSGFGEAAPESPQPLGFSSRAQSAEIRAMAMSRAKYNTLGKSTDQAMDAVQMAADEGGGQAVTPASGQGELAGNQQAGGAQPSLKERLGYNRSPLLMPPPSVETERSLILKAATDIDQLTQKVNTVNSLKLQPPAPSAVSSADIAGTTHITSPLIGLRLNMVNKDPKTLSSFLIDFAKLLGVLAVGSVGQELPARGIQGTIDLYRNIELETYLQSLRTKIGPWRNNDNEWYTDFFGHTVLGYAMCSYFKERGYSAFVSWLGTLMADVVWEFVLEGVHARSEWNDFLTTSGVGAITAALGQSINVGPIQLYPGVTYDPQAKKFGVGLSITQKLSGSQALSLSVSTSGGQLTTGAEYKLGKNVSVFTSMSGEMGKKEATSFKAGFKMNF